MSAASHEFARPMDTQTDVCMKRYPFKDAEKYTYWFCMANEDRDPDVVLLGSSFSSQLYAGLAKNPDFNHHSILSIGTCDVPWVEKDELAGAGAQEPCLGHRIYRQQEFIDNLIEKTGSVRYVIIGWVAPSLDEHYMARLIKRIDFLEKNNIRVIIFVPQIKLEYDIKACFTRPFKAPEKTCEISRGDYLKHLATFELVIKRVSATHPAVLFFNQNALFCGTGKCSMVKNGAPLLRDHFQHFTENASIEIAKLFEVWARGHAPGLFRDPRTAAPSPTG